jgi:hypothetical protein
MPYPVAAEEIAEVAAFYRRHLPVMIRLHPENEAQYRAVLETLKELKSGLFYRFDEPHPDDEQLDDNG